MSKIIPILQDDTNASTEIVIFETIYLDWFRNITVIYVAAIALMSFESWRYLAFWIFIVALFLIIVVQVDYLLDREKLVHRGIEIPTRLDWLWIGITGFFIIGIVIAWKLQVS